MEEKDFKVDLTNCDREPIHIPGKIQSHGMLLGFDEKSTIITHISNNAGDFFTVTPEDVLGKPLTSFLQAAGIEHDHPNFDIFLQQLLVNAGKDASIIIQVGEEREFHFILSRSANTILLEIEPVQKEEKAQIEDIISVMLTKILGSKSTKDTFKYSAKQVKEIIGYDRVMIYKFAPDGHGEVVAEEVNDGFESFMGLHYPSSDIPRQARELYKRNLVRIIKDVNSTDSMIEVLDEKTRDTPLDLSDSVLRAVSPIHIQYLKNMGVAASFSVSLISEGELWGLIACHNYSEKLIDYRKRNSCKVIGQLLSTSLLFREEEEDKEQFRQFNDHITAMIRLIRKEWDIPAVLTSETENILQVTEASGAALMFEDKIYTLGETPSDEQILAFSAWLHETSKNQLFQTNKLIEQYPPAAEFKDMASGVLSCALSRELNEYLIWFKPEMKQSMRWAGNPDKPVETDSSGIMSLSPRRSFDVWTQEVQGTSKEWTRNELVSAMKIREELSHIINERANKIRKLNEQLKQAYDELDTFSFTISHDLKTPLASVKNYSELLLESAEDESSKKMLSKIVKGADNMNLLIKEVLSYSRIGRQAISSEKIDMTELLEDIKSDLLIAYKDKAPSINVVDSPDISGDRTMLYQVFNNIIGNAVKYSSGENQPQVSITAEVSPTEITYKVEDNGIGIDMKYGDQIFNLFKRMDNASSFEGTGVGLAIVKRIIQKHNARIWYQSAPGNGTIFYISFKNQHNGK